MKRSEINAAVTSALTFLNDLKLPLPPFAHWTPDDWAAKGPEVSTIVERGLGWDVTDFGSNDFAHTGLLLLTTRNGNPANLSSGRGQLYAEKLLIVEDGQVTPLHFHWAKTEDLINRGQTPVVMRLFNATSDERLADTPVRVTTDGVERDIAPGEELTLAPGESVTMPSGIYHTFWARGGRALVTEVSNVNDDEHDNRFLDAPGRVLAPGQHLLALTTAPNGLGALTGLSRFPTIEEDATPLRLLCTDYRRYWRG